MKRFLFIIGLMLSSMVLLNAQESHEDMVAKYDALLLEKGTKAPDFKLETPDGKTLTLGDFKGKYLVLDFWAIWCPDCVKDLPKMKKAYERFSKSGVAFLGVSLDDDKEKWVEGISKHELGYLHGTEMKKWRRTDIAPKYKIDWIPTVYIVDPEGNVVLGSIDLAKVVAELERISKL